MSYIEAKHLTTGYDGIPLTKHINFVVEKGDYLCIVGENGAGKSTLMKTLLRLIPVIKGEIVYSDEIGPKDMGYLSQQTIVQKDFPASVWEIVLSGKSGQNGTETFYNKAEKKRSAEGESEEDWTHGSLERRPSEIFQVVSSREFFLQELLLPQLSLYFWMNL